MLVRCLPRLSGYVSLAAILILPITIAAAAETKGHTYSLFDGKSLHGWTQEGDCEAAVEDGNLVLKAGNGWLRSDHEYGDCVLHVEWQAVKDVDYDSGVYIRTARTGKPFPKPSYQCNLLQGKEGAMRLTI